MSIGQDAESFKDSIWQREINSEDTLHRYTRWARRFESWRSGNEPDDDMLREFDSFLQDEDYPDYPWENARGPSAPPSYAYQTRVAALSAAKLWLRHVYDTEVPTEVQNIAIGEPEPFEPTIIDAAEANNVIAHAPSDCDNPDCETAIKVGYDAIMRGAEIADARTEDVTVADKTLYVRAKKGSEPTNIQLEDDAWFSLKRHIEAHPDRDHLFRNSYGQSWTASAWNQHFRRKHHEAGFHSFARHSAITNRLRQGESFGDVYLRARHHNPTTTLRYVNLVGGDAPGWLNA